MSLCLHILHVSSHQKISMILQNESRWEDVSQQPLLVTAHQAFLQAWWNRDQTVSRPSPRCHPARNKLVQLLFICAVALCCSCNSLIYKLILWHIFRVFNEWPWIWSPRFAVRSFASSACLTSVRLLKRLRGLETCLTSDLSIATCCNMLQHGC